MRRDGTDHEWETWKTTSLHGRDRISKFYVEHFSSVGGLVILFPLFSSLCKRFTGQFALSITVSTV